MSRASVREWLWRNPHLTRRAAEPGESYVALHDTGGIDECFPTVAPALGFPDHGELWSQAWTVEARTSDSLALAARGVRAAYRLERGMRLTERALELDYRLESRADRELAFTWCLHPLLALEPGMEVLAGGAVVTRAPDPGAPGFRPSAEKRFLRTPERGGVALRTADGRETLRFRFDPREVPFVGLWLNQRGWSGAGTEPYFNLGIEPSIGDDDSLETALTRGSAGRLAPGASRSWRVTLEI